MFGISWAEFFVIVLVGVLVIPVRMWPDVARWLARGVKAIRQIIWKITDVSENIKQQIELEKPIDEMVARSANEILDSFSDVLPQKKKSQKTSVQNGKKK